MLMLCLLLNSYLVFLFLGMISGFHLVVNPVVYFHEGIHSWMKASLDCNDDDDDDDTPTFSSSWVFFLDVMKSFFLTMEIIHHFSCLLWSFRLFGVAELVIAAFFSALVATIFAFPKVLFGTDI